MGYKKDSQGDGGSLDETKQGKPPFNSNDTNGEKNLALSEDLGEVCSTDAHSRNEKSPRPAWGRRLVVGGACN